MKSTCQPYNDIVKTMEHKRKTTLFLSILFLAATILAAGSAMAAKVFRWVDENGAVHYSETLPPDFDDQRHDELDSQGIVRLENQTLTPPPPEPESEEEAGPKELPRDSSGMKRPKPLYSEEELQKRMDSFLLLRYDSEEEINNAMTVEINQLEYDRILLQTSRTSLADAYRGQIREAATRQRSGVEIDPEIIKSISNLQNRLTRADKSLAKLQIREAKIVTDFGAQLERYKTLIDNWNEGS